MLKAFRIHSQATVPPRQENNLSPRAARRPAFRQTSPGGKCRAQAGSTVIVDVILDPTIQVLLTTGSIKLNTTRVSRRAGVPIGTLYQYFPNKLALLLAVLEHHFEMLVSAVEDACRDHQDQMVEVMAKAVATAYLRAKAQQHEVSRTLYLIAIDLEASGSIGAATRRAERAIVETTTAL